MSPKTVRARLGPPLQTIRERGEVRWMVYGTAAERIRIYFEDNRVATVPRRGS